MSDSVQPHRRQPTRLPCSWDSPGKNTGVGCHFLLQCRKVKSESEVIRSCPTPSDPMDCSPPGSSVHGTFQARVLEWGAIAFSNKEARSPHVTELHPQCISPMLSVQSMGHNVVLSNNKPGPNPTPGFRLGLLNPASLPFPIPPSAQLMHACSVSLLAQLFVTP